MSPERKRLIGEVKVEEFYWNGRIVVYVDNRRYDGSFNEAINELEKSDR